MLMIVLEIVVGIVRVYSVSASPGSPINHPIQLLMGLVKLTQRMKYEHICFPRMNAYYSKHIYMPYRVGRSGEVINIKITITLNKK